MQTSVALNAVLALAVVGLVASSALRAPSLGAADGSVPVDVTASLQRGALGARPHVLLVPSDLGPFAKAAD